MIDNNIRVSIIIINYNTLALTLQCIESIYAQVESVLFEIIVVDNASSANDLEEIKKQFPNVICIQSDENLGFGRANNLGAQHAKGEYLFFLNSDTILLNDPFGYFFDYIHNSADKKIGVLGAFLLDGDGNKTPSGGTMYSMKKYLSNALRRLLGQHHKKEVDYDVDRDFPVDYVIGADFFIQKELFLSLGGFDPNIFMYIEEIELCRRINLCGYQSFLIKGPDIRHLVKASSSSQFARVYYTASLMYCIKKTGVSCLRFNLFRFAYFCLKFPVVFVKEHSMKENCEYLCSIFRYKKYLVQQ